MFPLKFSCNPLAFFQDEAAKIPVIPAQAGIQKRRRNAGFQACAGMTGSGAVEQRRGRLQRKRDGHGGRLGAALDWRMRPTETIGLPVHEFEGKHRGLTSLRTRDNEPCPKQRMFAAKQETVPPSSRQGASSSPRRGKRPFNLVSPAWGGHGNAHLRRADDRQGSP
jgi:hypothetical protein